MKELEKDPLQKVQQTSDMTTIPARRNFLIFSEEEQSIFEGVLHAFKKEIANKRVLIKPHFQDFDRTKQGYLSKNQFLRVLHQFQLLPDEYHLNLILRKYVDKGSYCLLIYVCMYECIIYLFNLKGIWMKWII